MAQKKNRALSKRDAKPASAEFKNGRKADGVGGEGRACAGAGGGSRYPMLTWVVVLALLGAWSSVAVVYFNIVDYDSVIARAKEFHMNFSEVLQGKLMAYDSDGDGDFDMEDAKVLLGLSKEGGANDSSLEEVLDILAEEGSDWFYGFFTFLHDVATSPRSTGEQEEEDEDDDEGDEEEVQKLEVVLEGVILDLQNQ